MTEQIDWEQITHYAGFDWAKDHHDVVVVNPQGKIVDELTFEHTADLGLRIRAADLDTLFAEAAMALFSAIVEDLGTIRPERMIEVRLEEEDRELLLFDWLKALLYHFDAGHLLFARFAVRVSGGEMVGTAWGEPLDRSRHVLDHEVKAITYHGLRLTEVDDGWEAEVIVDI